MAHGIGADGDPLILVVDDNVVGAMLVEDTLTDAGLSVAGPFHQNTDAARWLETRTPHAAILDIKVSDGSCVELVRTLRERGVPVVLHTSWVSGSVPDELRAVPYVSKPSPSSDLLAAMRAVIGKHYR